MLISTFTRISDFIFGFDIFCLNKKFLVLNLLQRNLKVKYRRSFFGFLWTILNPLAMTAIYYFVFKAVFKVRQEHYLPFILSGILPWGFFSATLSESTEALTNNHGLISKIPVPLHTFSYVISLTHFVTLLLSVPVIMGAAFISDVSLGFNFLWMFFFYFLLLFFSYCVGTILSFFYVHLRDLRPVVGLILQIWMYGTPVLYTSEMIPAKYHFILFLNPLASMFEGIHRSFISGLPPESWMIQAGIAWCLVAALCLRMTHHFLNKGLAESL